MTVQERIESDYLREVKAQNREAVSSLRMLKAALKNASIEKIGTLTDDEAMEVIAREAKKMRDALLTYRQAGREDMAAAAEAEIALFSSYLPQPLDDAALREMVRNKAAELGASSPKDMGRVMAAVMQEAKGRADGSAVSAMVKEILAGTS